MKSNKVYLIGAGPGDPGLLTIKAAKILAKADVVIYDNLVNKNILDHVKTEAELIYVGKQAARHTLKQEEINQLLVDKANANNLVARLKGGDPFIFGRGSEEAEYLLENKIDFEIIPGITSALSAPGYAGIPVTDRRYTSSFMVITGHEDPNKSESFLDWAAIAKTKGTLVILMGVKNLEKITSKLIENGRSPQEPSALVNWGTLPQQKVVTGNLKTIAELAVLENIQPPSILVVGDVINLRDKLNWFEKLPLFGKNIIITRPAGQVEPLKTNLISLGANVMSLPVIDVAPVNDYTEVDKEICNLDTYNWLIFTSVNGVKAFLDRVFMLGYDTRLLGKTKIAAIGCATSSELRQYGLIADFVPDKYLSEEIVNGLSALNEINGQKYLLARADIARKNLFEGLQNQGAEVKDLIVYENTLPAGSFELLSSILAQQMPDMVIFTSPSTVENFVEIAKKTNNETILNSLKVAAIGPVTSEKCYEILKRVDVEAKVHSIEGMIDSIVEYYQVR
jgi:uroporphyrinogen III methyltransferase/synthase